MIDVKFLEDNYEFYKELLALRNISYIDLEYTMSVNLEYRQKMARLEESKSLFKQYHKSKNIESAMSVKNDVDAQEKILDVIYENREKLFSDLPNIMASDTPISQVEADDLELASKKLVIDYDFLPQSALAIGKKLGILHEQDDSKMNCKSYSFKGNGIKLRNAANRFAGDLLESRGFVHSSLNRSDGDIPPYNKNLFEAYQFDKESSGWLMGTEDGIDRFSEKSGMKKQIIFCPAEDSKNWHSKCQENISDIMSMLGVPFRTMRSCAQNLPKEAYSQITTQAFFSSSLSYIQTHSNMNCIDYLSRSKGKRAKKDGKKVFPHIVLADALTDVVILAIIENNQDKDGNISVPKVLQSYMDGQDIIRPISVHDAQMSLPPSQSINSPLTEPFYSASDYLYGRGINFPAI